MNTLFNPPLLRRPNGRSRAIQPFAKPLAIFPGAVATDEDLLLAANRVITTLAAPVTAAATTITVTDASLIQQNMVLSLDVDGEIVMVNAPVTSNTLMVQRGFDSTTAVAHASGVPVLGNIVSFHHNALASEIESIEGVLLPFLPSFQFIINPANAIENGAVGDGVTDDTAVLQRILNDTPGILYLNPGKRFLVSSSLTVPSTSRVVLVTGGGEIVSTLAPAEPTFSLSAAVNYWFIDITITSSTGAAGIVCIPQPGSGILTVTSIRISIGGSGSGQSSGIFLANNVGAQITNSSFNMPNGYPISVTSNALSVEISNCSLIGNPTTVNLVTPGQVNIRGCSNTIDYYSPPVVRALAFQSTATTPLPNNILTPLFFDTTNFDFGNIISKDVNSGASKFTAPVAGSYLLQSQIQAPASTGTLVLIVSKNTNTAIPYAIEATVNNSSGGPIASITSVIQLAANDVIEFNGVQTSGAPINTSLTSTLGSMTLLSRP